MRFQIDYEKSKPLKVGRFAKQEDGSLVLANDKDMSFMVNEAIIEFWNTCDGTKTINQLTDQFSAKLGMPREQVEQEVVQLVAGAAQQASKASSRTFPPRTPGQ
ncbi:PqqD family protein [Candidatus Nitrososphaera sp. FF02]|uniref:PqqD family protein n=1 Tax=Candidatus Nitrososphaera sp. FF02 TaxID=3398226 RepID=UPI0039ECA84A